MYRLIAIISEILSWVAWFILAVWDHFWLGVCIVDRVMFYSLDAVKTRHEARR